MQLKLDNLNVTVTIDGIEDVMSMLRKLLKQGEIIMSDLSSLSAAVAAETTVATAAKTLIEGLAAQLAAAGTDPVKLADLAAQLTASSADLQTAITANTTAAPALAANVNVDTTTVAPVPATTDTPVDPAPVAPATANGVPPITGV